MNNQKTSDKHFSHAIVAISGVLLETGEREMRRRRISDLATEALSHLKEGRAALSDETISESAAVEALRKWKCGSCGGSGRYLNRSVEFVEEGGDEKTYVEEKIQCKVCGGNGLNPIASAVLYPK